MVSIFAHSFFISKVCSGFTEFLFDLFNCRQAGLQLFRQGTGELVFGNADWFVHAAQGIFRHNAVFVLAEDQTDRWLVLRVAQQVINSIEIKIHFAGVFRQEFSPLKLDDNVAAQFEMIKKQVDIEIIFTDFKIILSADKCESAPSSSRNFSR